MFTRNYFGRSVLGKTIFANEINETLFSAMRSTVALIRRMCKHCSSPEKKHLADGEGEGRDEYCEGTVDSCSTQRSTNFRPFLDLWVQGREPRPTYALVLVYVRSTLGWVYVGFSP